MAKKKGWVKIYRGIEESAIWSDSLRVKAWIHLLLNANHKDGEWIERGTVVKVKKGQFVTSLRKLSEGWGCNTRTVKKILTQFEKMGMIKYTICNNRYTLLTVIKYSDYQGSGNTDYNTEYNTEYNTDYNTEYNTEYNSDYNTEYNTEYTQTRIYKNNKNDKNDKEGASPALDPGGFVIED